MRDYDRIIIVCYPMYAGGNFLINSLSLSDQCVLRDAKLAQQQIESGFDVSAKLEYLHSSLESTRYRKTWNDLGLGCYQLFGFTNSEYLTEYHEILEKQFNLVISRLIKQKKYLFIVAHNIPMVNAYRKFWINSRVIFFTRYTQFIQSRFNKHIPPNLLQYWNDIKGADYPNDPPLNNEDFLRLPGWLQKELVEDFGGEIFRRFAYFDVRAQLFDKNVVDYQTNLGSMALTWDVNASYEASEDQFLLNLHKCANWVGLKIEAKDQDLIDYRRDWLYTISQADAPA